MVSRKRKSKRSKRRKRSDVLGFGSGVDIPQIDIPKIEIPQVEIPTLEVSERKPINPNKLSKIQLVSILTRYISSNQLYSALIKLGRHKLAEEFKAELDRINEEYRRTKAEVDGVTEDETFSGKLLQMIVDEVIKELKEIYITLSTKPLYEKEFQIQLEAFLTGALKSIEKEMKRLGLHVTIKPEFRLPHFQRRIDLMIMVGGFRVGIEMKYSLENAGYVQRLLGQIDEYAPYCDTLIVAVYKDVPSYVLKEIKNKEKTTGKPIRIVTPTRVWWLVCLFLN